MKRSAGRLWYASTKPPRRRPSGPCNAGRRRARRPVAPPRPGLRDETRHGAHPLRRPGRATARRRPWGPRAGDDRSPPRGARSACRGRRELVSRSARVRTRSALRVRAAAQSSGAANARVNAAASASTSSAGKSNPSPSPVIHSRFAGQSLTTGNTPAAMASSKAGLVPSQSDADTYVGRREQRHRSAAVQPPRNASPISSPRARPGVGAPPDLVRRRRRS
jgi:hypothetical protein